MRIRAGAARHGFTALVAATALSLLATSCSWFGSSGPLPDRPGESDLVRALGLLPWSDESEAGYGDGTALRELTRGGWERFLFVMHLGAPPLGEGDFNSDFNSDRAALGFDRTDVTKAVRLDHGTRLFGRFDPDAIRAATERRGYVAHIRDGVLFMERPEGVSDRGAAVLRVTKTELRYGHDLSTVESIVPTGETLADSEPYLATARCLGDVYYAQFSADPATPNYTVAALGARSDWKNALTERLCIQATSPDAAKRIAAALGAEARSLDGLGEVTLPDATVEIRPGTKPVVAMTWPNGDEHAPGTIEWWTLGRILSRAAQA
ncbi:hypothetical protein [Yinghuangia soli]|uniref:Lipoprotein n=1 Tax=Yinghuangia soli TaxID=2908204 RepID=A0AA41Q4H6_9ACTN|nr:hypothetical protein [Yinghuangia soli]MCF2531400.1 hypothetical protein [Yinghuangia soli]